MSCYTDGSLKTIKAVWGKIQQNRRDIKPLSEEREGNTQGEKIGRFSRHRMSHSLALLALFRAPDIFMRLSRRQTSL